MNAQLPLIMSVLMSTICLGFSFYLLRQLRLQRKELVQLKRGLSIASAGAVGMGQRVLELEAKLLRLKDGIHSQTDSDDGASYSRARSLIDQGLPDEVIAASCGISISEVSLMRMVHGAKNGTENSVDNSFEMDAMR
ncbi:MAG: hypothetical protein ACI93R_002673 [Flavobacteriales bacterium]|jgi:hypothetical protein